MGLGRNEPPLLLKVHTREADEDLIALQLALERASSAHRCNRDLRRDTLQIIL
jgi:hypothetical protein